MLRFLNWLIAVDPDPEEPYPEDARPLPSRLSAQDLDFVEREIRAAQAGEDDRERSTQARLIALLGLSSLLTAILSGMAAIATTVDLAWSNLLLILVLVVAAWVALQALRAIQCTVNGLLPKRFSFLPLWEDSHKRSTWKRRRRLSKQITQHRRAMWTGNRRMDDMILALRSLKRFAWGSAALFLVFALIVVEERFDFLPEVFGALLRASES
ncbi:MAG: hypothetical protein OXH13_00415 [Chloroflexi bacterium]|nr:hypothetical protein [Chloroflexota bacterium]MCY3695898.1 hypothetical protein [Chloroflexota bacterium]